MRTVNALGCCVHGYLTPGCISCLVQMKWGSVQISAEIS